MRFKTRPKKTKALRAHAKLRALQRYDLDLTAKMRRRIVEDIQQHKSIHLDTQSHRVSIHLVEIEERDIRVVYDRTRKEIVTVLPPENESAQAI
mgnify:CR=1 FL=1